MRANRRIAGLLLQTRAYDDTRIAEKARAEARGDGKTATQPPTDRRLAGVTEPGLPARGGIRHRSRHFGYLTLGASHLLWMVIWRPGHGVNSNPASSRLDGAANPAELEMAGGLRK